MVLFASLQPTTALSVLVCALALSGFAMGVSMPSTSSLMANEVSESDFGVMSAAQILAMQVPQSGGQELLDLGRAQAPDRGARQRRLGLRRLAPIRLALIRLGLIGFGLIRPRRHALCGPGSGLGWAPLATTQRRRRPITPASRFIRSRIGWLASLADRTPLSV